MSSVVKGNKLSKKGNKLVGAQLQRMVKGNKLCNPLNYKPLPNKSSDNLIRRGTTVRYFIL